MLGTLRRGSMLLRRGSTVGQYLRLGPVLPGGISGHHRCLPILCTERERHSIYQPFLDHRFPFSSNSLAPPPSLVFTVRRSEPELVAPAKPTPREVKLLSDIDDQDGLRFQSPVMQFYRYDPSLAGKDPVDVIRKALAKTLVFYYPFAGRLREGPGRKLMVDCTGEGVLFIEADADVTLQQFGDALLPPFPCREELLYDVPGSAGILNTPLLLIQVTRLKCGGFIFAIRLNHTMSDGIGMVQFMTAIGEIARGAHQPSTPPVWCRELLNARDPPRVTCTHHEYEQVPDTKGTIIPLDDLTHRSFFFGPTEVAAILRLISPHQQRQCTKFDIITACLWRCRTIALQVGNDEEVRIVCTINARAKFDPPLPNGYYGNVIATSVAISTVKNLSENPLGYALELVRKAKDDVTEEYMHSLADLLVTKGRPQYVAERSYFVTDMRRVGYGEVDFGWGKAMYGGPPTVGVVPGVTTFYIPFKNAKGEEGLVIPVCLPSKAMERFVKELDSVLNNNRIQPAMGGLVA